ncbi:hypothetical protein EF096_17715 [Pseudomonas neustonica]|uniref:DUF4398 domain-containing protein n=1 Tax=Pseudomonas neustonica TaxID=2487346 RepID=A0ABX9XDR1_9PSED|nr:MULTISPECIES: hypothetical protein [Pseudomonas]ROZ80291.1 hypothetical protein EF099_18170 [Pseudomonas sp. SSM44]ROZ81337.1 hypothetical protein EF096_17715 [Pseudomonas neustonica]
MHRIGITLLLSGLLLLPNLASAQNAPEVSQSVEEIVGDARLAPNLRIKRSVTLLQARAQVERQRDNSAGADRLEQSVNYLLQAPAIAEAAELAAQAAEAADAGDSETALVFAESAAQLDGAKELPEDRVLD